MAAPAEVLTKAWLHLIFIGVNGKPHFNIEEQASQLLGKE